MGLGGWVKLRAGAGKGPVELPPGHVPYMVLPKGGTGPFSCANCKHLEKQAGEMHCDAPPYARYAGTTLLTDAGGKAPLDDASRACSDWFEPA